MPRIVQYEAPENIGLQPTEIGVTATAAAARRVQSLYSEVAASKEEVGRRLGGAIAVAGTQATDYMAHAEISQGSAAYSGILAAKTKQWNDVQENTDPNNPTIAPNFMQGLEADLGKFKSGFLTEKGQLWAEHHVESLRTHFAQKTAADQSRRAGEAIAVNSAKTLNNFSYTVYNDPSEHTVEQTLKDYDSTLGTTVASSPTLQDRATVGAKLKQKGYEAIVKAGAQGYIERTGEMPPWLDKYKDYVNLAEIRALEKQQKQQDRANQIQQKQLEQLTKQANDAAIEKAAVENNTKNVGFDENTGKIIVKPDYIKGVLAMRNMPGITERDINTRLNWAEAQQQKAAKVITSNPDVRIDLLHRIGDPDNPTTENEILSAGINEQLNGRDVHQLRQLWAITNKAPLRDPALRSAMQAAQALIGSDPVGKQKYADFVAGFMPQYIAARQAGQAEGALDFRNDQSMIRKAMQPQVRDLTTKMIDKAMQGETTVPGAPAAAAAIPPPAQRKVDQTYQTPAGPKVWKGNGWADPPQTPAKPTVPASQ